MGSKTSHSSSPTVLLMGAKRRPKFKESRSSGSSGFPKSNAIRKAASLEKKRLKKIKEANMIKNLPKIRANRLLRELLNMAKPVVM